MLTSQWELTRCLSRSAEDNAKNCVQIKSLSLKYFKSADKSADCVCVCLFFLYLHLSFFNPFNYSPFYCLASN